MIGIFLWLALLFLPGLTLAELLGVCKKGLAFREWLAYPFLLGSSLVVSVFFAKTFLQFPVEAAPLLLAVLAVAFLVLNRSHQEELAEFPKPSRADIALLVFLLATTIQVGLHLTKFPVFPFYSGSFDFQAHVRLLQAYLENPASLPAAAQLLYWGVHYLITLLIVVSTTSPDYVEIMVLTRHAMGLLTIISTLWIYLATWRIFNDQTKAFLATMIYSLAAFLWFGEVFNSGLFPSFYGLMADFLLIAFAVDFLHRKADRRSLAFLLLAVVNALLSHYSAIILFPVIAAAGLLHSRQNRTLRQGAILAAVLAAPLMIGLLVFPGILSNLLAFRSEGAGFAPGPTPLASYFSFLPVLAYAITEITNDYGTAIMLFVFVPAYALSCVRSRSWLQAIPGLWLLVVIAVSPLNSTAWRFAFVALTALTPIIGGGFGTVMRFILKHWRILDNRGRPRLGLKGLSLLIIVTLPMLYSSWGSNAFSASTTTTSAYGETDYHVLDALGWMKLHTDCSDFRTVVVESHREYSRNVTTQRVERDGPPRSCLYVTPTDWRLTWSATLAGVETIFNPSLISSPRSASFFALEQNADYIVVTNATTATLPPSCYQYAILLKALNSTASSAVQLKVTILTINASGVAPFHGNVSGSVIINQGLSTDVYITNGEATGILQFEKEGVYDVKVVVGIIESNTLSLYMGEDRPPLDRPRNLKDCYPWFWTSEQLSGATIMYENPDVRIWCITDRCRPRGQVPLIYP